MGAWEPKSMKRRALIAALSALSANALFAQPAFAQFTRGRQNREDGDRRSEPSRRGEDGRRGDGDGRRGGRREDSPQLEGGPRGDSRSYADRGGDNRRGDWDGRRGSGDSHRGDDRDGRRGGADNHRGDWDGRRGGDQRGDRDGRRGGGDNRGGERHDWNRSDHGRNQGGRDDRGRDQGRRDDRRGDDWGRNDRGRDNRGRDDRRDYASRNSRDNRAWHSDGRRWRDSDWDRGEWRRYAHTHRDFRHPRYTDWRRVPRGRYFDDGYARIARGYFGHSYYWWNAPGWRRPYRPYRVGYALPRTIYWDYLPYDFYYRLPRAPHGCRYVAVDRDIVLIVIATGLVLDALLYAY